LGGTGLTAPGTSGNVLTSNGTSWVSSAPTGGGGGSRTISTVTSATTLGSTAGNQYVALIGSGGSVTLPTAVGNTSWYTLKNIDTVAKTISTVGDDPYWASVTSLLQGNGDNNAQIFTDSAPNSISWSPIGGVKLSNAVKKFGSASISFDGTTAGTCLYPTTAPSVNPYSFGTGDFTIEMWVYFNAIGNMILVDGRTSAQAGGAVPTLYTSATGVLTYYANGADRITTGSAVSISTWHHVAVSRSGTSTKMFFNGTQVGSTYTDSTNYAVAGQRPLLGVSAYDGTTAKLNGYLDDIRITKGIGRYTANFTAPTTEFAAAQLIDGNTLTLAPNQAIELVSNGSSWSIISNTGTETFNPFLLMGS